MDIFQMSIAELLAWASDIRGTVKEARRLLEGVDLTPSHAKKVEEQFAKEARRARWLDELVLMKLEDEDAVAAEDADGQVP